MEGLKGEVKAFTHRDEEKVERLRAKDQHPEVRVMNKKKEGKEWPLSSLSCRP
jgi:hypothetical protein